MKNERQRRPRPFIFHFALIILHFCLASFLLTPSISACPFCSVTQPTLAERRAAAETVALAEVEAVAGNRATCRVHRALKGTALSADQTVVVNDADGARVGGLAIVFGDTAAEGAPRYSLVPMTETSIGYFAGAPETRLPAAERLVYFVRFLEHADPLVAQDAFGEFGRAPFDAVAAVADRLPMPQLRGWLRSDAVPPERKGFYGLALGLAREPAERQANLALLSTIIDEPASDFRAGFDGQLAGYLLLAGEPGLAHLEARLVARPDAPTGDVRHLLTALRFYREYGRAIPRARLSQALAPLLRRPDVATTVIADLARAQAWDVLPQVVALVPQPAEAPANVVRAVAAFLLVCPTPAAREELDRLRRLVPERVAEAEQTTLLFGGDR